MTVYSGPTSADLDHIPAELKARPQWVLWRGADRLDTETGEIKLNKIPIDPQTLHNASSTDPQTWGTFPQCVAALPVALEEWAHVDACAYRGGGVGFVFSADDPYCGVDLDHCRNPDTGTLEPWAQAHVDALASYTEVTPSSTGVHVLVQGALPPRGRKKGAVEVYSYARFFTMTGWHVASTPPTIEARQSELTAFHTAIFGAPHRTHQQGPSQLPVSTPLLEDTVLLDKACAARNGAKVSALLAGDTSTYGNDDSVADMALCIRLAFWTQDPAQLDRLFRQSGLMRSKWDAQRGALTYGERTIAEALARQSEHYTPPGVISPADSPDAPSEDGRRLPYSDYTNACALVRAHGQDLRYCWPWGRWLVWTGTHWQSDETGVVMRYAKSTIKRLAQRAPDLDDTALKALLSHIKSSLGTAKLKAMIESAQSEPESPVLPDALDADRWLLNCTNGTLDLRTGTLRPHNRADLLTKALPVAYEPDALCSTWDTFLDRIMGGNTNLISFLQRAVGYALTGVIREHVLLILWGTGRNGKSTFLNALLKVLGAYGVKAPSELLMVSQNDRHPTEKTLLHGKRFAITVETEQGRKLAEAFVKEATGGDPITARRMREDPWTFEPTHKVFLATNHKPDITGTDNAIWERIKLVEFNVTIPPTERDTTLPDKLHTELPGILAWAVRGCLAWQQNGLGEPDEVQQATAGYRASMDVLGEFIAECCLVDPRCNTKANELYEAYKRWRGDGAEDQRTWGMALTERGFERYTNNGTRYRGIGILDPLEDSRNQRKERNHTEPPYGTNEEPFPLEDSRQRNQRNHTEPLSGVNSDKNNLTGRNRKSGSVGSVGSVSNKDAAKTSYPLIASGSVGSVGSVVPPDVDIAPTDTAPAYEEGEV